MYVHVNNIDGEVVVRSIMYCGFCQSVVIPSLETVLEKCHPVFPAGVQRSECEVDGAHDG